MEKIFLGLGKNVFDADYENPKLIKLINKLSCDFCVENNLKTDIEIKKFIENETPKNIHKIIAVYGFTPHESDTTLFSAQIGQFMSWLHGQDVDINKRSDNLKKLIYNCFQNESTKLNFGRTYQVLDNIIIIDDIKIAIEIEASQNMPNGFMNLTAAIKQGDASLGIMIVPYTAKKNAKADEAHVVSMLDHYYDGGRNSDIPMMALVLIRIYDIIENIKEKIS